MFIALTPGGSACVRVCTRMHTCECVSEEKRCFLLGPHAKAILVITYIKICIPKIDLKTLFDTQLVHTVCGY